MALISVSLYVRDMTDSETYISWHVYFLIAGDLKMSGNTLILIPLDFVGSVASEKYLSLLNVSSVVHPLVTRIYQIH